MSTQGTKEGVPEQDQRGPGSETNGRHDQTGDDESAKPATPAFADGKSSEPPYFLVERGTDGDLHLKPVSAGSEPLRPGVAAFLARVQTTDTIVNDETIIADGNRRNRYAAQVEGYAFLGLTKGDIDTANALLDRFERGVADTEGPGVRRRYLVTTVQIALITGAVGGGLGLIMTHVLKLTPPEWQDEAKILRAACMLLFGNALGVSFFAFNRNLNLKFDQLGKFDPALLQPFLRFTLVFIISAIVALLLFPDFISISLGTSRPINHFFVDPLMAVIIGIICGYSDVSISNMIAGRLDSAGNTGTTKPH